MSPRPESIALIERLIAFDTTSRNSNLELIDFIRGYLRDVGVESELVHNQDRSKANLYATLGPEDRGGIALSGHTDVVPVDGQKWGSDPFRMVKRDGQLFGRGTSDMKSFIGVCLALAPEFLEGPIKIPIHLAFSYDEEIGCLGVRGLIKRLSSREVKPKACIIGEPTMMKVVRAHKGKLSYRCQVSGLESHSGMAHLGVNAVEAAAEVIAYLKSMARRFRDSGPFDPEMSPPYTTVHTGRVRGGTQLNIVPRSCEFEFEFRHLPQDDPVALLKEVQDFAAGLLPEMHAVSVNTGFHWERQSHIPQLNTSEDSEVVQLAKSLTGANATAKVSFGTEAGLFEQGGMPAVVCGPGSIEQAHKPDEYIALDQVAQCEKFILRLFEHCWK
ncbi:MAG TPA: acetylornithine deacetylase [Gammaproteobacteria bacterium]|nr:acetylornithine deacetylase [Gammaproteobacteria bacterium]